MKKKSKHNIVVPYGMSEKMFARSFASPAEQSSKSTVIPIVAKDNESDRAKYSPRKSSYYDYSLKRQETRVSVTPFATIERSKEGMIVGKYIHSPYIISEKYQTEYEIVERVKKAVTKAVIATLAVCGSAFLILWAAKIIAFNI